MTTSRLDERPPFGQLLRDFRLAAGLSQEALAERAAMSINGISALERGASHAPQRETLKLLVKALGLNTEQAAALEQAAVRPSHPRNATTRARENNNLPRALTPFFGRTRDIDAVTDLIANTQLVTLTGAAGVGKTRLALKVAEQLHDSFHDGIRLVDLAPIRDGDNVTSALASQFGVKQIDGESLLDRLTKALNRKNALIILDNCEHLAGTVASIARTLIAAGPRLHIIATSRQSLNVPGEQIYRVGSLELDAAIELFIDRAKRAVGSLAISDEFMDSVARVVRRLDGIALAIELAAARTSLLTVDEIEARLSERFHVLSGGSTLTLPRHQTMRTTLDWSYDLLSPVERTLFRRLWIFPASFSMEAAIAICCDEEIDELRVFDLLASLVDKSLVVATAAGKVQRYRLLETMRAYAAEKLSASEIEQLLRRHAQYFAAFAQRMEASLGSAVSTAAWARSLESDADNFRSALDWALAAQGDVIVGARILSALQEFWIAQGYAFEADRRAHATLMGNHDLPEAVRAALWLTLARMRQELFMHPHVMLEAASYARELYESINDRAGLALALRQQGAAQMRLGTYAEAQANFERSTDLYRELGDRRMVVRGLGYLASLLQVQQAYQQARSTLLDVLQMVSDSGDDRMIPTVVMNLAEAEFALGEVKIAAERSRYNLNDIEMDKSNDMRATQEANLAAYLLALGKSDEARAMALDSVRDAVKSFAAVPLQHFAAAIAPDDPETAATLLGYVEAAFEKAGFSRQYTERYTYDLLISTLKERLVEVRLTEFVREGRSLSENQARKLAHQKASWRS